MRGERTLTSHLSPFFAHLALQHFQLGLDRLLDRGPVGPGLQIAQLLLFPVGLGRLVQRRRPGCPSPPILGGHPLIFALDEPQLVPDDIDLSGQQGDPLPVFGGGASSAILAVS